MSTKTVLETLQQPRKTTYFTFVSSTRNSWKQYWFNMIVLNKSVLAATYCLIIF